ncbi:MAG: tetratricopeptide repeat protein, partial [Planctomycetales bacterium]|nr:tetratricopeptide repeat protein [Planctomycetales bacterium]
LAIFRGAYDDANFDCAEQLNLLGEVCFQLNDREASRRYFSDAVNEWRTAHLTDESGYLDALRNLGDLYVEIDAPLQAEPYYQEAIRLWEQHSVEDDFAYSTLLNQLANVYFAMNELDDAEPLYAKAIEIELNSEQPPQSDVVIAMANLARVYRQQGKLDRARELLTEAGKIGAEDEAAELMACGAWRELAKIEAEQKNYEASFAALDAAEAILRDAYGTSSIQYADLLRERGMTLVNASRAEEGASVQRKAWDILAAEATRVDLPPGERQELADAMDELATLHADQGDASQAAAIRAAALDVKKTLYLGEDYRLAEAARDVADDLRSSRLSPADRVRLGEAEARLRAMLATVNVGGRDRFTAAAEKQLSVYRDVLGDNHRETRSMLENLGTACRRVSCYDGAYHWFAELRELEREAYGVGHPRYAKAARELATAARKLGDFEEAIAILEEILEIQRNAVGESHAEFAATLADLADARLEAGDAPGALRAGKRAAALQMRLFGERSTEHAATLRTIALAYRELGEEQRGANLLLKVHQIFLERLDIDSREQIDTLLYAAIVGKDHPEGYEATQQLFDAVLETLPQHVGEDHPDFAYAVFQHGTFLDKLGKRDEAIAEHRRALAIYRTALGDRHPATGDVLGSLAHLYSDAGRLDEAIPMYEEAIAIDREYYHDAPRRISFELFHLAETQARRGATAAAADNLLETIAQEYEAFESATSLASESGIQRSLEGVEERLHLLVSLALASPDDVQLTEDACNWTLRHKGAVLDALCRVRRAQRILGHHSEIAASIRRMRHLQQHLADLAIEGGARDAASEAWDDEASSQEELDSLREKLAFALKNNHIELREEPATVQEVRRRLPSGAALVELATFRPFDVQLGTYASPHYAAFVLNHDESLHASLFDLGPVDLIDESVAELRELIQRAPRLLGLADEGELEEEFRVASRSLYELTFGRFEERVAGANPLYVSLDGELHKVPLAALSYDGDSYLIERQELALLGSGRDLLRNHPHRGLGAVIFANPDFEAGSLQRRVAWQAWRARYAEGGSPVNDLDDEEALVAVR